MSLLELIPEGTMVTVDTAPIIYVLEGHPRLAARYAALFEAVDAGRNAIVVSAVTLAEVLAGPLRRQREALAMRYRQALVESPGWSLLPVDADVAESAARLRIRYGLKLPDAIQLATAVRSGSSALVTHDRDFTGVREIAIVS